MLGFYPLLNDTKANNVYYNKYTGINYAFINSVLAIPNEKHTERGFRLVDTKKKKSWESNGTEQCIAAAHRLTALWDGMLCGCVNVEQKLFPNKKEVRCQIRQQKYSSHQSYQEKYYFNKTNMSFSFICGQREWREMRRWGLLQSDEISV